MLGKFEMISFESLALRRGSWEWVWRGRLPPARRWDQKPPLGPGQPLRTDSSFSSDQSTPVSSCHGASQENKHFISDVSLSLSLPPLGKQTSLNNVKTELPTLLWEASFLPVKTLEISGDKVRKMKQSYKGSKCGYHNPEMRQETPDPFLSTCQELPLRTTESQGEDSLPISVGPMPWSRQKAQSPSRRFCKRNSMGSGGWCSM